MLDREQAISVHSAYSAQKPLQRIRTALSDRPGRPERIAMVLVFLVLIAARLPNSALHGRVWAEESIFLGSAAALPWYQAIFHSYGGYLNLVANLAGMAAHDLVSAEGVRWVGVATGLLFQAIPAALIVSSGFDWLQNRLHLTVALLLIATVPVTAEVWLNSLHPQFHLTLCAALILAMNDPVAGWNARFRNLLLLLGALCGPTTWFLLPLFAARAVIDRSRPRAVQAAVLAAGVILQLLFWFEGSGGGSIMPRATVYIFFIRFGLTTWLDYHTMDVVARILHPLTASYAFVGGLALAELLVTCLIGVVLWRRDRTLFWMFAAAVMIAIPCFAFARGGTLLMLNVQSGGRYVYVPQVLIGLVLLGIAVTGKQGISLFARIGVVWLLAIGIWEFHNGNSLRIFDSGPRWLDEVAAWRADPTHVLRIWPQEWVVGPAALR